MRYSGWPLFVLYMFAGMFVLVGSCWYNLRNRVIMSQFALLYLKLNINEISQTSSVFCSMLTHALKVYLHTHTNTAFVSAKISCVLQLRNIRMESQHHSVHSGYSEKPHQKWTSKKFFQNIWYGKKKICMCLKSWKTWCSPIGIHQAEGTLRTKQS